MFDIRDELWNLLEEDLVPVCPPRSDVSESSGPAPTTPLDDNDDDVVSVLSSAESGFIDDMDEIGELQPVPGGVAVTKSKRKNVGLFIEFGCQEGSPISKVANVLDISYLGVTRNLLDVENDEYFQQLLLWVQDEIQVGEGPVHLWGSLSSTAWLPWNRMAMHKYGESHEKKLETHRTHSLGMIERFEQVAELVKLSKGGSVSFAWSRSGIQRAGLSHV